MEYKVTYMPNKATITVPNQGLSVKQILERFTRGQGLPLWRKSHDDPQNLDEDEQMQLHECEDEFERQQILIDIEEGRAFNDPPKKSNSQRSVRQVKTSDSEVVERSADSDIESADSSETSDN